MHMKKKLQLSAIADKQHTSDEAMTVMQEG